MSAKLYPMPEPALPYGLVMQLLDLSNDKRKVLQEVMADPDLWVIASHPALTSLDNARSNALMKALERAPIPFPPAIDSPPIPKAVPYHDDGLMSKEYLVSDGPFSGSGVGTLAPGGIFPNMATAIAHPERTPAKDDTPVITTRNDGETSFLEPVVLEIEPVAPAVDPAGARQSFLERLDEEFPPVPPSRGVDVAIEESRTVAVELEAPGGERAEEQPDPLPLKRLPEGWGSLHAMSTQEEFRAIARSVLKADPRQHLVHPPGFRVVVCPCQAAMYVPSKKRIAVTRCAACVTSAGRAYRSLAYAEVLKTAVSLIT
jgi:hypothetical protein